LPTGVADPLRMKPL